jgi:cytochrome c oxidase assembly protein subunit 15
MKISISPHSGAFPINNPQLEEIPVSRPPTSLVSFYAKFVVIAVFFLIFKGALVTSNNAGLAVPDWPTTFGHNMFLFPMHLWEGGIFYEHGHRVFASLVGALTFGLTVWLYFATSSSLLLGLGITALGLVIVQGLLGGLTVLWQLPDFVSVAHGMLGQTFFLVIVAIAFGLSKEAHRLNPGVEPEWAYVSQVSYRVTRLFYLSFVVLGILYLQLFFGAVTRHAEAGLAIPDFPTMAGKVLPTFDQDMVASANDLREELKLPPVNLYQVAFHAMHRIWAIVAIISVIILAAVALSASELCYILARNGMLLVIGIVIQSLLGIAVIMSGRNPWITSFHVWIGALVLATTFLMFLRAGVVSRKLSFSEK